MAGEATTARLDRVHDGPPRQREPEAPESTLAGVTRAPAHRVVSARGLGLSTRRGWIFKDVDLDVKLGAVPGSPTPGKLVINGGTLQATATFSLNSNRGVALGHVRNRRPHQVQEDRSQAKQQDDHPRQDRPALGPRRLRQFGKWDFFDRLRHHGVYSVFPLL